MGSGSSLNITGPITMSAWINISASGSYYFIIGGFAGSSPYPGCAFLVGGVPGSTTDGHLAYWSGAFGTWVEGHTAVNDGTWHFVAVTVTGSTVQFYIDEVADGAPVTSSQPSTYSGPRTIGKGENNSAWWNELLDDVRIYNTALSAASISNLYNSGIGYTADAGNEMTVSPGPTFHTYDGSGNLLTSLAPGNQLTTNSWDGENRLIQVALPSGIIDTFAYNGDGLRVQKQDSTGTTKHVWDEQNILLETNASNVIQVEFTLEPVLYGNLISQSRGGVDSFYLFDALGSTRQLANSAGVVTDGYLYDSFGNINLSGATINPFSYVGRVGYYLDADTRTYYVRQRQYAPSLGRFLSRDPLKFVLSEANEYQYALNNPVTLVDPSGLSTCPQRFCGPEISEWLTASINKNRKVGFVVVGRRDPSWFNSWNPIKWGTLLSNFADNVKAGGPWDYKSSQSFKTAHCPSDCPRTTTICGICFFYDIAGNVNYGYIGSWMYIPLDYLLKKAAEAQKGGVDPSEDIAAIKLGASLAMLNGGKDPLTVNQLCSAIKQQQAILNKALTDGCTSCTEKYPLPRETS